MALARMFRVSCGAALALSWASLAEAAQTRCTSGTENSPCTPAANGGDDHCCSPGWVFANNWSTSGNITDKWGPSSLQFSTTYNLTGGYGTCCQAYYAGIGSIGTDWVTDQYNTGG